ncbi:GNAT family N-acetyltransferase [Nocardioides cavernaquae]|uniref:GNAT family N-acetyltransferase n=1 Tax=Nocardioides cavernaquae TaxID=2321396 RepID=A0A3A5H8Q1_9ACTN|nr:GNAT family N-acetyltransferase [Nocardioides cavernaquae]RJS45755.1 GNAT family N-acetyltransferase [Nocardioides cavernaquae]
MDIDRVDEVRIATPADAAVVAQMLADFNREFDAEGQDAAVFAARLVGLLARSDLMTLLVGPETAPVGFALVTFRPTPYADGPLVQLEELYVRPGLRSQGAGSALIAALMVEARRRGALEVLINVDEPDVDARRFYERHGFTCLDPDSDSLMLCYLGAVGSD